MIDLHLPALLFIYLCSNRFPFGQRNLKFASILALYFIHIVLRVNFIGGRESIKRIFHHICAYIQIQNVARVDYFANFRAGYRNFIPILLVKRNEAIIASIKARRNRDDFSHKS